MPYYLKFVNQFFNCSGISIIIALSLLIFSHVVYAKDFRGTFLRPWCSPGRGIDCLQEQIDIPIHNGFYYSVCSLARAQQNYVGVIGDDGKCHQITYSGRRGSRRFTPLQQGFTVDHWEHGRNRAGVGWNPLVLYFRGFFSLANSGITFTFMVVFAAVFVVLTRIGDRLRAYMQSDARSSTDTFVVLFFVFGTLICAWTGQHVDDQNAAFDEINAYLEMRRLDASYFYPLKYSPTVRFDDWYTVSKIVTIPLFIIFHTFIPFWMYRRHESFFTGFSWSFIPSRRRELAKFAPEQPLPLHKLKEIIQLRGFFGRFATWNETRKNRKIAQKLEEDAAWLNSEREILERARRREFLRTEVEMIKDPELRRRVLKEMGIDLDTPKERPHGRQR